jgi:hypothetical protein
MTTSTSKALTPEEVSSLPPRSGLKAVWDGVLAGLGALLGLLPHVLHHVGFLAGTALVAGSGGTALFGALGYLASIPLLLRIRRRFGTWRAPAIGLLAFTAMFALSALVVGPTISGSADGPAPAERSVEHGEHHTS